MKIAVRVIVFCFIFMCIGFLSSCMKGERAVLNTAEIKRNISLIMNMNNGHHWGSIKMGADTAAREFNVNVDINAPNDEEDVKGQINLVEQAIEKKADAIILAASDYKALVQVTEKAYDHHIPVIVIDSEVDTKKINSFIATDDLNAGKKAGNALVDISGKDCRVAIMSFVKGNKNAEQREEGLLGVFSKYPDIKIVSKEYCSSDIKLASQLTKKVILEKGPIDAIVALNSAASEGVAEVVDQMGLAGKIKVICFDNTPKEIDYLEEGIIQGIVTQNSFSMGYLGVKYAVDAINGKAIPGYVDTGSKIIDRENMYLPENQKLLFPFVK